MPRRRFNSATAPLCSPSILNLPIRVSFMISAAHMQHIRASHSLRRESKSSITAAMWGSINSIVATIMSASAIASLQAANLSGRASQSAAACTESCNPGTSLRTDVCADSNAALTWLSSVINTTRTGSELPALSAVVRFCFIQGLDINRGKTVVQRVLLGVPSRFSPHKEGDFFQLPLRARIPPQIGFS